MVSRRLLVPLKRRRKVLDLVGLVHPLQEREAQQRLLFGVLTLLETTDLASAFAGCKNVVEACAQPHERTNSCFSPCDELRLETREVGLRRSVSLRLVELVWASSLS